MLHLLWTSDLNWWLWLAAISDPLPIEQLLPPPAPWYLNPQNVIAASTAFIAMCAFGLSGYQIWRHEKHQKLSVVPRLDFSLLNENDCLGLYLHNDGLGPASLQSIEFLIHKERFDGTSDLAFAELGKYLIKHTNIGVPHNIPKVCLLSSGTTITAGQKVAYLKWEGGNWSKDDLEWVQNFHGKVKLNLKYQDLYETKFDKTISHENMYTLTFHSQKDQSQE